MKTLERRLADALRHEAGRLPDEESAHTLAPKESKRPGFLRPGLAAPAAVVVVMILAAPLIWLSAEQGGGGLTPASPPTSQPAAADTSQPVATTTPTTAPAFGGQLGSVIDQLPEGFDPERASPFFATDGGPEKTAIHYLATRHLTTDTGIGQVVEQDGYTLVQWAWGQLLDGSGVERGESGWLLMRPTSRGYEILAATTDGVDLSDVTVRNGNLRGTVQSDTDQELGVDVLNQNETPVASAPNPEGMPDADFRWGTAGAGTPPLALDLPVTEPVTIRVNRVGGALLSISEVVLGQGSDDSDDAAAEDGPAEVARLPEPAAGNWIDLPGGVSVAVVEEDNGHSRIWMQSPLSEPTPAPSRNTATAYIPVDDTTLAVLIVAYEHYEQMGQSGITPFEPPDVVKVHWFEGSDAVDTVEVDWSGDPRFGVALVEARDAEIYDVEFIGNS